MSSPSPSPAFDPITLHHAAARAGVLPHGAHVTSWRTADGADRLYLSPHAVHAAGSAIRGGIPVIFPQFSAEGALPRHGFARTRPWRIARLGDDTATLALDDDDATRAIWPHPFAADLTIALGTDTLAVTLAVTNTGADTFTFTAALHTYLAVRDVERITVDGLVGVAYRDQTANGVVRSGAAEPLRIAGDVDRVYLDVPGDVVVRDAERTVRVAADGFPDVVVWNPGAARAASLADVEPDGWRRFVCVEAAAIARPVSLAPGAQWRGTQRLAAR